MSTQLKLRRGTTAQHSTFTGASGEITVDTTKKTVVVHDGTTAGGVPLAKESDVAGFLTSATAASTYQTQAGMSSYLTSATAASTYQALSARNAANGYAGLDSSGLIPTSLMPVCYAQSNRIDTDISIPDGYNGVWFGDTEVGPNVTVTGLGNSTLRGL